MDDLFYSDPVRRVSKSYPDLVADINQVDTYNPYCKEDNYYEVFKQLVISLLYNREIVLLDSDFSHNEVSHLLGDASKLHAVESLERRTFTIDDIAHLYELPHSHWKVSVFTSGTTGTPKKVSHRFDTITRQVRKDERHARDVWGFAYNPTHMAGLQVFFQALLNMNHMVRLFGLGQKDVIRQINAFQVSHISATPTFYRLLFSSAFACPSVRHLTSGGEAFDEAALTALKGLFPNAKLTNVYASTEAGSLFAAKDGSFVVKQELSGLVRDEDGELLIHKSLLGESDSFILDGEWYHTGDLIEVLNAFPLTFRFVSRKNEMINVGGYKVNPHEVEEALRMCKGVCDARVFSKPNRLLGHVVCGEIVADGSVTEKAIREVLRDRLQEFKIPRIITFVDALSTTRTGKVSRKESSRP